MKSFAILLKEVFSHDQTALAVSLIPNQLFFHARARAATATAIKPIGERIAPKAVTSAGITVPEINVIAVARAPPEPNNAAREPIAEATEPVITRSGPIIASIAPMATTVC